MEANKSPLKRQKDKEKRQSLAKEREELLKKQKQVKEQNEALIITQDIQNQSEMNQQQQQPQQVMERQNALGNTEVSFSPQQSQIFPGWDRNSTQPPLQPQSQTDSPPKNNFRIVEFSKQPLIKTSTNIPDEDDDEAEERPKKRQKRNDNTDEETSIVPTFVKNALYNSSYMLGVLLLFSIKTWVFKVVTDYNTQKTIQNRPIDAGSQNGIITKPPNSISPPIPRPVSRPPQIPLDNGKTMEPKTFFR